MHAGANTAMPARSAVAAPLADAKSGAAGFPQAAEVTALNEKYRKRWEVLWRLRLPAALPTILASARFNLGLALATQGDVPAGITMCLDAIRQSPNEPAWHYEVAMMLLSQRRVAEAVTHLNDTLRLDPSHEGARQALAAIGK